jgi:arylformamidase
VLYRGFSTQEELDAQYNLREAVPDFPRYKEFYERQSRETRERLERRLDVPYGPTLAEHLDVFPAAKPDAPILVFFHGGYWHTFGSKDFSLVAEGPVSAGVTTVVTNYALCPKVTIEEIVRQSRAAIAWVYENTLSFGGDRERIYVSGHSAGGHLTAMVALTDWEADYGLPADIVKGGCPISGLFDLAPFPYTYLQPKLQLTWDQVLRNSPILRMPDAGPPLLVTYGDKETPELRRQSDDFLAVWRSRGLRGEHLPQPGKDHFSAIDGFLDATSPLCSAILEWMSVQP